MVIRSVFFLFLSCLIVVGGCSDTSDNRPEFAATLMTPPSDCFWQIQRSPGLFEDDNRTWTDLNGAYGNAVFVLPQEGAYITLENQFPSARFMSYSTYNLGGGIIDTLTDKDISPDSGSTNPYIAGNPRNDPSRIYSVTIGTGVQGGNEQLVEQNNLTTAQVAL